MGNELIHDRGRGPELVGTRITVYDLLVHFLQAADTEAYICKLYGLVPEQVAAARAYVLNNAETILARHLEIEERNAAGNPPEVIEEARKGRETFVRFKQWLEDREKSHAGANGAESNSASAQSSGDFPTFRDWVSERGPRAVESA
jgi:uncharacterized protein (DUF433 family)